MPLPMLPPPSPLVERQLEDDMMDFLKGPGPAVNAFAKGAAVSVYAVTTPPPTPSTTHDTKVLQPTKELAVAPQHPHPTTSYTFFGQLSPTEPTLLMLNAAAQSPTMDLRKNSLPSNNPFKARARKTQMDSMIRLNSPSSESKASITSLTYSESSDHIVSNEFGAADNLSQSPPPTYESVKHGESSRETASQDSKMTPADRETSRQTIQEILVVVMGPRGSGKKTFISSATGASNTSPTNISSTGIQSYFVKHLGHDYHLLDTPGFDNELRADIATQQVLLWLEHYYSSGQNPENTIILYLHSIGQPRLYGSIRRSLEAFKSLMKPKTWSRIVLGTTGWTAMEKEMPGMAAKRESELLSSSRFWKDMHEQGAGIMRVPEQDIFAVDTLRRLRERAISRKPLRSDSTASGVMLDETTTFERKADFLEYERRVLELVTRVRSGHRRPRIAASKSAFHMICNECRENIGTGTVYQCRDCYRDTAQKSFILCSTCYEEGKTCDNAKHWQTMSKKTTTPVDCKSHTETRFKGWDFIPCSLCDGFCDIVFLRKWRALFSLARPDWYRD
jgi:hypothetical protein